LKYSNELTPADIQDLRAKFIVGVNMVELDGLTCVDCDQDCVFMFFRTIKGDSLDQVCSECESITENKI